jgi:hypothetical protein
VTGWRGLAAVALLLMPASAWADELPGPDDVDAHCTLEEQCPHGHICVIREASLPRPGTPEFQKTEREFQAGVACRNAALAHGDEVRCGTKFRVMYCPKGEHGTWTDPRTPEGRRKRWIGYGEAGGVVLLLCVGGFVLMRRRRAR